MDSAIPIPPPAKRETVWRVFGAVTVVAAAMLFSIRLGDRALVSEEHRWAEISREMRDTGDYWRPTLNGQTYHDKPAGSYWLIVAASYLTGGVNELAARLPSAIFGAVGVGLVVSLGRRVYDLRVAVLAGAILATSFGFALYARRATADMETVVGVLASLWLYVRFEHSPRRFWVVMLWLSMAATSLTKGLLGFALPLVVMTVDTVWGAFVAPRKNGIIPSLAAHSGWLLNRWSAIAIPLGIGVYFLPFWLSFRETGALEGLEMVWRENVKRFVDPHNHKGPVTLYFGVIFVLAAPWSVFLPAALVPLKRNPSSRGKRFIGAYFWAVFAFFTLSASRRSYYLLPVLPPAALLIANLLTQTRSTLTPFVFRVRRIGWFVFGAGVAAGGVALFIPQSLFPVPYDTIPPLPYRTIFGSAWVCGAIVFALANWGNRVRCEWVAVASMYATLGYGFGFVLPDVDDVRTRREFAIEVNRLTADGRDRVALYRARDVVFDLGRTVPEFNDADALVRKVKAGEVQWVVTRRRYRADLTFPVRIVKEETVRPWEGTEQIGDKMSLLEVVPQ